MKTPGKSLDYLLVGALLFMMASCAPLPVEIPGLPAEPTATPTTDGNILANSRWLLVSYGPSEAQIPVIEGTEVTLEFQDQARLAGSAGCNTFGADYSLTEEFGISITNMVQTEIACTEEGVMEQEGQYLSALQTANLFEHTGDTLKIWYDDSQSTLTFSRQ